MTTTTTPPARPHHRPGRRRGDVPPPDTGCLYAPRCASCPYTRCILELDPARKGEFVAAWRTMLTFVAPPDGASP